MCLSLRDNGKRDAGYQIAFQGCAMSIVSLPFLFLFLPLSVLIYHLIPAGKNLFYRNIFLVAVSLFFYAWGEPLYVFLLLFLMLFVHIAGKMIDKKRGTAAAKVIIAVTAVLGIGVILFFRDINSWLSVLGRLIRHSFAPRPEGVPLGMAFFVFFAVSYVVDINRGKCHSPKSFLHTALYLSAFFKVTQGPIIEYHQFQSQIENRPIDRDKIYRGTRRFLAGLAKKAIIASSLSGIATWIFSGGSGEWSVASAWIVCIACLVDTYIDFSAYSDMACGLALLFGFTLPENFNYPYISRSVTEYWQRWHMTLIQWFRDYLYYPITLGPSVRFRKLLLRHGAKKKTAKILQNVFVPACVWIPTALWHGTNLNYLLWGILNCAVCIIEMNRKPLQRTGSKSRLGRLYTLVFLMLMMPLMLFDNIGPSLTYYGAMFGIGHPAFFDDMTLFILREYGVFILAGLLLCFPVREKIAGCLRNRLGDTATGIIEDTALLLLSVLSVAFVIKTGSSFFIYQMF